MVFRRKEIYRGYSLATALKNQEDYAKKNGFIKVGRFPLGPTYRKSNTYGLYILNILKKENDYIVEEFVYPDYMDQKKLK